jgi:tetratricopeptide (TPR) repeat protein
MAPETGSVTVRLTEAEARLDAALALAQTGKAPAAWSIAKAQIEAFPDEPVVLREAGVVARLRGDHASALTLFKRVLAAQLMEIADLHAGLGEKDEAPRRYRQAIEARPDYAAAYLAAAKLACDLGRSSAVGATIRTPAKARRGKHAAGGISPISCRASECGSDA